MAGGFEVKVLKARRSDVDYPPTLVSVSNMLGVDAPEQCTVPGCPNPVSPAIEARFANPMRSIDYTHHMCPSCAQQWDLGSAVPQDLRTGEPMDLAFRFLKHAVSPEAKRHKSEYDTKFESTPERKKYHADLNRERRKRGIYGHGGPDMSHTKEGTLVAEDPHANRARHFKERGTLKAVGDKSI